MQRMKRAILTVLLIAAVFSGTAVNAVATNLPAGMLIGDQNGIHVDTDGAYFIDAEDLEAGDVITRQLVIRNTERFPFRLSMTTEPLEETGLQKLLDEINLKLEMEGRVLYNGRVRGDEGVNMVVNALDLGVFETGQQKTLEITLTVNPEMTKLYWTSSEAQCKWIFHAVQEVEQRGPQTGEMIQNALYFIMPGLVVAMGVLLLMKKKRQEENKTYGGD